MPETMTDEQVIGDRLHAIHGTMSGLHARRYMPGNYSDSALHPLAIPFPGQATYSRLYESMERVSRTWTLAFFVGAMLAGIPTESAQKNAEVLIRNIREAYGQRDRLQLSAGDPLDFVISAQLQSDTGIYEVEGLARVDFPILIIYDRDLTLL